MVIQTTMERAQLRYCLLENVQWVSEIRFLFAFQRTGKCHDKRRIAKKKNIFDHGSVCH